MKNLFTYDITPEGDSVTTMVVCRYEDRPQEVTAIVRHDVWSDGLSPEGERGDMQPSSGIVALMLALMTLIAFGAPQLRRILSSLDTDLLGVRRRANAFESHTASESHMLMLLLLTGCVSQAILIGIATDPLAVSNGRLMGCLIGLTTGYCLFQYAAYGIVGYTFTDKINAEQWRKGFNLSQGVLGLVLLFPAVISLYYHEVTGLLVATGATLYIIARIAFICKGFRIFYNNLSSLVYFILYLCALEIIPVTAMLSIARRLSTLL